MMTPTLVLDDEGVPRLVAGSAGSVRLAGAILQVVEAVVGQGSPVAEAISRPRLHVDGGTAHVEGGWAGRRRGRARARTGSTSGAGRTATCSSAASSAVERRPDGDPRRGRRSAPRRARGRRPMIAIRPAEPADASELVALAAAVGRESGDWLLTTETWRPVADERRYLKAVRRHPTQRCSSPSTTTGSSGRLSLARDPHPASAHVADLGLMVAASHRRQGIGRALLEAAVTWVARPA